MQAPQHADVSLSKPRDAGSSAKPLRADGTRIHPGTVIRHFPSAFFSFLHRPVMIFALIIPGQRHMKMAKPDLSSVIAENTMPRCLSSCWAERSSRPKAPCKSLRINPEEADFPRCCAGLGNMNRLCSFNNKCAWLVHILQLQPQPRGRHHRPARLPKPQALYPTASPVHFLRQELSSTRGSRRGLGPMCRDALVPRMCLPQDSARTFRGPQLGMLPVSNCHPSPMVCQYFAFLKRITDCWCCYAVYGQSLVVSLRALHGSFGSELWRRLLDSSSRR